MASQGDSVILYNNAEIRQFISDSLDGKTRNSIKAYARVGTRFADELLKISDEDVAGYYLELDGNRIEHINDHVETDSDNRNIPLTDDEALEITEYINNYTEILDCVKRKDGSKRIYLSKVKPDGVVVVVELISKGRSSIQPVTAWKNTVDAFNLIWGQKKKATNTSLVAKTATHRGYKIAFNDSISNSDESVNTESNLGQNVDETQDFFSLSDEAGDIGPVGDFSTPLNTMYYGEDADTVDDIGPVKDMRGAETSVSDTEDIVPVVAENAITEAPISLNIILFLG